MLPDEPEASLNAISLAVSLPFDTQRLRQAGDESSETETRTHLLTERTRHSSGEMPTAAAMSSVNPPTNAELSMVQPAPSDLGTSIVSVTSAQICGGGVDSPGATAQHEQVSRGCRIGKERRTAAGDGLAIHHDRAAGEALAATERARGEAVHVISLPSSTRAEREGEQAHNARW